MATPRAILRASKAAQPTPAPQGAGQYPSWGNLPQYSLQPPNPYAPMYGPFLPRPPDTFTSGAFGPFSPILPVPIDQPPPGAERPQPRRWQPYVGFNLPIGQPGTEGYKLASFSTLKALGDYYSIMRTCLEIRKNEIRALDWDIVLTPDAAKAYRGDRAAMRDFGERRDKIMKFFRKPDPNYDMFSSWLYAALEQVFVYDALSLYLCPTKDGGRAGQGVLGSGLDSLWLVDGSSIRPMMGLHGEKPAPPAVAYQQYEFGVPRADFMMMRDGRDLDDAGLNADDLRGQWRGDQLLYLPYVPRTDSPYGFSLVEQGIIPIMTGLRKQAYQLEFFSESTIPAVYVSPGDNNMTPNQIRELQDALNAIAGDIAWRYKVIVLPPGSKTMPQKDIEIVDQADEWIATEVCMVANINPMEVGILPRISTVASPFAAREMAQASRTIHQRTSTKPTLKYLTEIANLIIQQVLRQGDIRFLFSGMDEEQDLAAMNDMDIKDVQSGIKSIDEVRDTRGLVPWGLEETTNPIVITQNGPLPLAEAAQLARASIQQAIAGPSSTGSKGKGGSKSGNTGAHAAAAGSTGRKAIPAGVSGVGRMNGPVTQRQARRGGALAPAHATAEGTPGRSGGKVAVPAAVSAELEALARHLRKGRHITTWEPRHVPGHLLSLIAEDLNKGLGADEAVDLAKALVLAPDAYEWADKAAGQSPKGQQRRQQQAQQRAQQLAAQYQARIQAAFNTAINAAAKLIAQWAAGTLAVTAAVLAGMIAALILKALSRTLRALWRKAWAMGVGDYAWDKRKADEALRAFLATAGRDWAERISQTKMADLEAALKEALLRGGGVTSITGEIERILQVLNRAEMIAVTEVTRAYNAAMIAVYKAMGIAFKQWNTRNDAKVCPVCRRNQDQGPVPLDALFSSGDLAPGAHPNCRCWITPAQPPKQPATASKGLRRQVDLNGQVTYHDDDTEQDNAAGGGATGVIPRRTTDSGAQPEVPGGVPGATAGGEPPRWDGTEPFPYVRDVNGGDDGSEMRGPRSAGTPARGHWPAGYMDEYRGWWPQGGHGTGQAPGMEVGAGPRGRPPGPTGKTVTAPDAASFLKTAPKAEAAAVYAQLLENYPPESIAWVKRVKWVLAEVPMTLVDFQGRDTWAASHQRAKVNSFVDSLKAGRRVDPAVAIIEPGHTHIRIIDGHHRTLAAEKIGWPIRAWVGYASGKNAKQALEAHASQIHQGADPGNKSFTAGNLGISGAVSGLVPFNLAGAPAKRSKPSVRYRKAADPGTSCGECSMFIAGGSCTDVEGPIRPGDTCDIFTPRVAKSAGPHVAGLMVRAGDTGRVLMLQRALSDDVDGAAGKFEPPGGHVEAGETLLQGATREWQEEVGHPLPPGAVSGSWDSSDGVYRGFVVEIPAEDALDLENGRGQITNPDGDVFEVAAWLDPADFDGNPSLRPEVQRDLPMVLAALNGQVAKSALTPMLSTTHNPLGPHSLWHTPDRHTTERQSLPDYIENVAHALERDGHGESSAIALAIAAVRAWSQGHAFGGKVKVTPQVQAAASAALAEWERLKESHH